GPASTWYATTGIPAAAASPRGAFNAFESTSGSAIPSAFESTADCTAFTTSFVSALGDPVQRYEQPTRAQASWMPYWRGTKSGLVVRWLMNENFHVGCLAKPPALTPVGAARASAGLSPASAAAPAPIVRRPSSCARSSVTEPLPAHGPGPP